MRILFLACLLTAALYTTAQPPAGNAKPGDNYGAPVNMANAVDINSIKNSLPAGGDSVDVAVVATVADVCPKKGCWLRLQLENGEEAFVKMKDYAFFLPTAVKGKKVVINGQAFLKTTPVAELQHYAKDAKKPQAEIDAITEPKKEVGLYASGIRVVE